MANQYCTKCGKPMPDGSRFCTNCGSAVSSQNNPNTYRTTYVPSTPERNQPTGMTCRRCGGTNITSTPVAELKKRGCFSTLLLIILCFIPIIGWIAVFAILRGRKTKTRVVSVCQNCGYRWYTG